MYPFYILQTNKKAEKKFILRSYHIIYYMNDKHIYELQIKSKVQEIFIWPIYFIHSTLQKIGQRFLADKKNTK